MKKTTELPEDFLILTDRRLDGTITAGEQAELERHLLHTPGAMAHYVAMAEAEALLADEFPAGPLRSGLPSPDTADARSRRLSFPRRTLLVAGTAAAVASIFAGLQNFGRGGEESSKVASAKNDKDETGTRVMRTLGVTWSKGGVDAGGRLSGGPAEIAGGFVDLKLASGVRLLIEGPAAFDITGRNACRLVYGKAVADVPDGAQGFTLDSPRERIVDHGTRFAVDVGGAGGETTLGVLSGEVELKRGGEDVHLYTDYAVKSSGDSLASIPFDRSRFATEIPSREFPWSMKGAKPGQVRELRFDVSRLVHGPGEYRAVFKWLQGEDMLNVASVELLRDGIPVARSDLPFSTGHIGSTRGNAPVLRVADGDFAKGRWELVARASCQFSDEKIRRTPPESAGIVTLEDGLALAATAKSFSGRWHFSHNGVDQVREFLPDGRFRAWKNGGPDPWGDGIRYEVKDGILTLYQRGGPPETHMLRDDGTLVFLNQPYRNAYRQKDAGR